jgi:hypothetical protein
MSKDAIVAVIKSIDQGDCAEYVVGRRRHLAIGLYSLIVSFRMRFTM